VLLEGAHLAGEVRREGGQVVAALAGDLGFQALAIGDEIAPGVPWTVSVDGEPVALALKSGNFGGRDFFLRAAGVQP
jgi:uncharacterized protein YgbK (DUF1537 family)